MCFVCLRENVCVRERGVGGGTLSKRMKAKKKKKQLVFDKGVVF